MRWVDVETAAGLLSYPHDVELVRAAPERAVNRERFPGLAGGWARLDGPAGTQMVDVAIEAMAGVHALRATTRTTAACSPPRTRPTRASRTPARRSARLLGARAGAASPSARR